MDTTGTNNGNNHDPPIAGCFRGCRKVIAHPELMQPTILAISITYIVYAILANFNVFTVHPASSQFALYCCILGLLSVIIYYLRYCNLDASCVNLLHVIMLLLILGLYVTYWFVSLDLSNLKLNLDLTYLRQDRIDESSLKPSNQLGDPLDVQLTYKDNSGDQKRVVRGLDEPYNGSGLLDYSLLDDGTKSSNILDNCIDKVKCSHPLHLVMQSAFVISVLVSLINRFLPHNQYRYDIEGAFESNRNATYRVNINSPNPVPGYANSTKAVGGNAVMSPHSPQRSASSGASWDRDAPFKDVPTLGTIINSPRVQNQQTQVFPFVPGAPKSPGHSEQTQYGTNPSAFPLFSQAT